MVFNGITSSDLILGKVFLGSPTKQERPMMPLALNSLPNKLNIALSGIDNHEKGVFLNPLFFSPLKIALPTKPLCPAKYIFEFLLSIYIFKSSDLTISFTSIFILVFGAQLSSLLALFELPKSVSTSNGLKYSLSQATIQFPFLS